MSDKQKIQDIVKGRTCCVIAKGNSIENLKINIEQFKDKDICWATLNDFHYIEETILDKIGRKFELVSDCATVSNVEYYEKKVRIPRFEDYLSRDNNLLMLSNLVVQQCFRDQKRDDLLEQYKDKIITIDSLFSDPACPKEVWNKPPNSITLLYAFLIAGGTKKIINFGLDGTLLKKNLLPTYYMPEVVLQERKDAFGDERDGSLKTDTFEFNKQWENICNTYKKAFNNPGVQIYNCSPNSTITAFPNINYTQIQEFI